MYVRGQLEAGIAAALARLSDADMQRVAEEYARTQYPDRFPRFDFRAFSEEGKSRGGWPDAWIEVGGTIDGVEATSAKTKAAVNRHLGEYLDKARERDPKLAGFLHVSGHPSVQFTEGEIVAWKTRFVEEAGIPSDRLDLVFGPGLIEVLSRPEFTRTRIELLNLPSGPAHFRLARPMRGPDEARLNTNFVPSDDDYAAGWVHRPAAADQVTATLEKHGCALVRGVGASGKSVLAWLLALESLDQGKTAYMLDAADYPEGSSATSAIADDLFRFSHPSSLFIIDNCHLNEPLVKEVALVWQSLGANQQPHLLLLGRELRTSRGSLIEGLPMEVIALKATQPELLGVYRRLALRHNGGVPPPLPPADVLSEWVARFGGDPTSPDTTTDLIAFSAAVSLRMADLLERRWALNVDDAIEEIRNVYLHPDKLPEDEFRNLIRLCVVAELELSLSAEGLPHLRAGFERSSLRQGLVFRQTRGSAEQYIRYQLPHPALSPLILRAAPQPVDRMAELKALLAQHPFSGTAIISRLRTTGRLAEARELAREFLQRPQRFSDLGSLQYMHMTFRNLRGLGVELPPGLSEALLDPQVRSRLTEVTLQTSFQFIRGFLEYAARTRELRPIFLALAEDLSTPESLERLTDRAFQMPLDVLAHFLDYADAELRPVVAGLTTRLGRPEFAGRMRERILQSPPDLLVTFLRYASAATSLKPLYASLAQELNRPETCQELRKQALRPHLDLFANFLDYAAETPELKPLFVDLTDHLADAANLPQITALVLQTPILNLPTVLACFARIPALKQLFESLARDVLRPENVVQLRESVAAAPLGHLANLLSYAKATEELKSVFQVLSGWLVDPEFLERTKDGVLLTEFGDLQSFLAFMASIEALRPIGRSLADYVSQAENIRVLGERASQMPLDQLSSFLVFAAASPDHEGVFLGLTQELASHQNCQRLAASMAQQQLDAVVGALTSGVAPDLWAAVLAAIDTSAWETARSLEEYPNLSAYAAFQGIVVRMGRPELARAPALRIIRGSSAQDWRRQGIVLRHLSQVVRLGASTATAEELDRFLDEIATPELLDPLIKTVSSGQLASTIFSLAMALDPHRRDRFARRALQARVRRELELLPKQGAEARAATLCLLGAAVAIGVEIQGPEARWPTTWELAEAIRLRTPPEDGDPIDHRAAQLWLGLRALAALRPDEPRVPAMLAEPLLARWVVAERDQTADLSPNVRALNSDMLAWLQRCKAAGWRLSPN